jgi:hypothetical protein
MLRIYLRKAQKFYRSILSIIASKKSFGGTQTYFSRLSRFSRTMPFAIPNPEAGIARFGG